MTQGFFITFEGIEGSGKSTQITLAAEALLAEGYDLLLTREPGGTSLGDSIRRILLDPMYRDMDPMTELLLYAAARRQHVAHVIQPALQQGKIVLCDRYVDATQAYQGSARKIDAHVLDDINAIATHGLMPSLTLLFDCPVDIGLTRARKRNQQEPLKGQDRFEQERQSFHEKVREKYLLLAAENIHRIKIIDTTHATIETLHHTVMKVVKEHVEHNSRS